MGAKTFSIDLLKGEREAIRRPVRYAWEYFTAAKGDRGKEAGVGRQESGDRCTIKKVSYETNTEGGIFFIIHFTVFTG